MSKHSRVVDALLEEVTCASCNRLTDIFYDVPEYGRLPVCEKCFSEWSVSDWYVIQDDIGLAVTTVKPELGLLWGPVKFDSAMRYIRSRGKYE